MPRRYEQKVRAARQEQTRSRIVDAAIELHEAQGPARTTVTEIAERAGVGRLTVYRHFPQEEHLLEACSTAYLQREPPPDPGRWLEREDPRDRLSAALTDTYAYHRATAPMMRRVLADVGDEPVLAPYHAHWRAAADVVARAWAAQGSRAVLLRAAVGHALAFSTWDSLTAGQGLDDDQARTLMLRLVAAVSETR